MENIEYKDSSVHLMPWSYQFIPEKTHTCFCCNQKIKNKDAVIGLINNGKYFPNVILHKDCWDNEKSDKTTLFDQISSDYALYKQLNAIFGDGY